MGLSVDKRGFFQRVRSGIGLRTPIKDWPKFSGATQLEPYLAQFRLVEWHNGWGDGEAVVHLALALEGTAVQALLDLAPEDQRDLQALIPLERRFGQRAVVNHSREPPPPGGGTLGGLRNFNCTAAMATPTSLLRLGMS